MNMKQILFNTEGEYIGFLTDNNMLNETRTYGNRFVHIENGDKCCIYPMADKKRYISSHPKEYPCIMVYSHENDDYEGRFIYKQDFDT